MMLRRLLRLVVLQGLISEILAVLDGSRFLWYSEPAKEWEQGALPIGNGRLAGTIFRGGNDVLTINEDSIWSGPIQDRTPANGLAALPIARDMFLEGNITEGGRFVQREMNHREKSMREYSYFGNLDLSFSHADGMTNYLRWLDTKKGNAGVSYDVSARFTTKFDKTQC